MGYSTTRNAKGNWVLACDDCGSEGARRRRCPYGYCPASVLCSSCYDKIKTGRKEAHAGCEIGHAKVVELRRCEEMLLEAGHYLRVAAVTERPERETTKVWFRNKEGKEKLIRMNPEAYKAFSLAVPVTDIQYRYVATTFEEIEDGVKAV